MNKYEKSILCIPQIIKVLYVIICITNLMLPLYKEGVWKFSMFQLLACIIHFFGLLAGLGYLITSTHEIKDGAEVYEQRTYIDIVWIGILRLVETIVYMFFKKGSINWIAFGALLVLDVIFIMILLVDKSRYGYAKEITEDKYDFGN